MSDRIQKSDINEYFDSELINRIFDENKNYTRVFYPGIVINNNDPKNSNRIQVRIPFIDDTYYLNVSQTDGNKLLPWCSPISRNFISTPEQNSIIIVGLFDPITPYWGRMYFDGITDLNNKDLFDYTRLTPEINTYNNWNNIQLAQNMNIKSIPKNANQYNTNNNVKYKIGLRGKGNNRITLDNNSISIYQNENTSNQSMLEFTNNIDINAANNINITSKIGNNTNYHPVFDQPLYNFLSLQNNLIKSIIQTLISVPALQSNTVPCIPSPEATALMTPLLNLYEQFNKLKLPGSGASKQIFIN